MTAVLDRVSRTETARVCEVCKTEKPIAEFRLIIATCYRADGPVKKRYRQRTCVGCMQERWRVATGEWAARNPEKLKASRRKYFASEKGKAAMARYRRKQKTELVLHLPNEPMKPYARRIKRDLESRGVEQDEWMEIVGVNADTISNIIRGTASGNPKKMVEFDVCDRLAVYGDFSLIEMEEAAETWAKENDDPWPEGYVLTRPKAR